MFVGLVLSTNSVFNLFSLQVKAKPAPKAKTPAQNGKSAKPSTPSKKEVGPSSAFWKCIQTANKSIDQRVRMDALTSLSPGTDAPTPLQSIKLTGSAASALPVCKGCIQRLIGLCMYSAGQC